MTLVFKVQNCSQPRGVAEGNCYMTFELFCNVRIYICRSLWAFKKRLERYCFAEFSRHMCVCTFLANFTRCLKWCSLWQVKCSERVAWDTGVLLSCGILKRCIWHPNIKRRAGETLCITHREEERIQWKVCQWDARRSVILCVTHRRELVMCRCVCMLSSYDTLVVAYDVQPASTALRRSCSIHPAWVWR